MECPNQRFTCYSEADKGHHFLNGEFRKAMSMISNSGRERRSMMKRSVSIAVIIFLLGITINSKAGAEEASPGKAYSGDFWSRSTMTGDWGGIRNEWASKGVAFDLSLTQIGMSVVDGGKNQGWEYTGRGNLTINVDTGKLGLWPGGSFMVEFEGNYNKSINLDTGAIMPVNTSQFFPTAGKREVNIPAVAFTQFLSQHFAVMLGKLDTISADANEFAHGKGDKQFFNLSFNINPAALLTSPSSALGAGVMVLPTGDPGAAIITLTAIDADGVANRSGFDTAFDGDTTYALEGRVRTNFFGLTGHQLAGGTYSSKDYAYLSQDLRFIIMEGAIEKEDHSWCFYYNFDQYLYEPRREQGVGIFGRFGASDGDANPVHYIYSIGVGGKGVIPGRSLDSFGLGYYFIDISSPKFTGPISAREFFRDEYGVEAYYSIAITPWMQLTPDIQVIRPAQKKESSLDESGISIKKNIDTATVIGARLHMIF
jgi:porin